MIQKSSCKDILRRRSLGRRRCPHLKSLALIGAILSIASTPTLASDDVLFSSQIKDVSEAKFIDTFEGRGNLDQNELGGRVEASENVSWQREKTPYTFGRSLKLAVDLLDARSGWWKSDFGSLDVSQAKSFSFWVKGAAAIKKSLTVTLVDLTGKKQAVTLESVLGEAVNAPQWQEIAIPTASLKELDLNRLKGVEFYFKRNGGKTKETLWLDNLAFLGEPYVFFQSLRDNLNGYPESLIENKRTALNKKPDFYFLKEIAKDTWRYFDEVVDVHTGFPLDNLRLAPALSPNRRIGDYTSPTNIGLYLVCVVGAQKMGLIDQLEAETRIRKTLDNLSRLETWNGFVYNYYNTTSLNASSTFISSVDTAWLLGSLMVVREAFPSVKSQCDQLLGQMNFKELYDNSVGQMRLGYDNKKEDGGYSSSHYGLLITEARIASVVAIAKGDLGIDHWFRIYRTVPKEWDWQSQVPQGVTRQYEGQKVFEGYYVYGKQRVVPSWGGSLFEFLMPSIFVDEKTWAPESLGKNNAIAIAAHRDFARQKKYPVWGISPATVPNETGDSYAEYGIAELGTQGYSDKGVVTPHVSFLALHVDPENAIKNIRELIQRYDIYGPYGLYDSVHLGNRTVAYTYLALDQAMTFISIVNYLKEGYIQKLFEKNAGVRTILEAMKQEQFELNEGLLAK